LQSRQDVLCALSLGVTERAKRELCFYVRRRPEPARGGEAPVDAVRRRCRDAMHCDSTQGRRGSGFASSVGGGGAGSSLRRADRTKIPLPWRGVRRTGWSRRSPLCEERGDAAWQHRF
jgi:hypothetical protein